MSPTIRSIFLGTAGLAGLAWAQSPPAAPPALAYSSAFEGYRPFDAGEVQDWRKSNDTVREVGGWRAYAREIQAGTAPAPGPAASGAAGPAPGAAPAARPAHPHQGHHR